MGASVNRSFTHLCPFPFGQVPVVWKRDYQIRYEFVPKTGFPPPYGEAIFGHVNVSRWNKTIRENLLRDVDACMKLLGMPVLAAHNPKDLKHFKFLTLLKFHRVPDLFCTYDGIEQEVWIRYP